MVTVVSIYLRSHIEVGVGVGTFLPIPTPQPGKRLITFDSEMCDYPVKWVLVPCHGKSSNFSSKLSELSYLRNRQIVYD
jgi:hypothetical protein